MYLLILATLLISAAGILTWGIRTGSVVKGALGLTVALATLMVFGGMDFWGEKLWFQAVGYLPRFWTEVAYELGIATAGLVLGAASVWALTWTIPSSRRFIRWIAAALGGILGLQWGAAHWMTWLRFRNRVQTGAVEPILDMDAGFYLFTLPLLDALQGLAFGVALVALLAASGALFLRREGESRLEFGAVEEGQEKGYGSLYAGAGLLLLALSAGAFLGRFHLLYSEWGVVHGPGWTDAHVRMPAHLAVAVILALLGLFLLVGPIRRRLVPSALKRGLGDIPAPLRRLGWSGGLAVTVWVAALGILPGLVQWLRVEPNEITLEEPYIANNIEFTRRGFHLDKVQEREFSPSGAFDRSVLEANREVFRNIRLWDYRALDAVYKQFQEIRLYYEFHDVDIDRYQLSSGYREVMVSAREMELQNLPPESQTFVNRRFKYTHGYGATLTNVSEFTPEGLPHLLVRDIPPQVEDSALAIHRPEIYFGELTRTHVVVNSETEEFDYPSGDQNRYVQYQGDGGVPISNVWKKFLFGWKFDGTRFFFSSYPRPESRLMFHREIRDRVETLAPFLEFDADPYVVIAEGRLYWIIDAYTTSQRYPYSEPFSSVESIQIRDGGGPTVLRSTLGRELGGINYIRNSVKAVVDAYSGQVDFYVYEPDDPLIRVYSRIFPGMFKEKAEMPGPLRSHVRYPADMLLVQGLVFAKYHMVEPTVFYNQEDLWVRATEKYYGGVQPVEPYYIMWNPPGADEQEFTLILPFTPKNRQVLIGWIAGMCDQENYGDFLAYRFPKEERILGPQQVETKIDQDPFLSGQLTLWDQRGSNVIRGNVLAIPVGETLIYVEPIYLQAQTAAYPELRLVAVMHGDDLSYAETFDEALRGLFQPGAETAVPGLGGAASLSGLITDAQAAFREYLQMQGEGRFQEAAAALEQLERLLQDLTEQAPGTENSAGGSG